MNTEHPETLAAVLAEMRAARNTASDTTLVSSDWLDDWADRIERAAKRDYEEAKAYFEKLHDGPSMICTAKNCSLRNAAEDIVEQVKAEASFGHFAPVVVEDRPVGNAAAMREALSDACYAMFKFLKTQSSGGYEEMAIALDKAKAALAAPARNCDRFQTAEDALDAFIRENEIKEEDVDSMNLSDFFDWLFAPAEGGEK